MVGSAALLRALVHLMVASSLTAAPPPGDPPPAEARTAEASGREYAGDVQVEVPAREETPAPAAGDPGAATEPATEPVAPRPEGPVEEEDDLVPYDPLVDSPEAQRARSWVRTGAVFIAVGGVLAIGGAAMATAKVNSLEMQNVCEPRGDHAGNGCQEGARDRAAVTLGLPGGVLLAAGIAMLVVGKVQQRRLRASVGRGLALAPGPGLGLGLRAAF